MLDRDEYSRAGLHLSKSVLQWVQQIALWLVLLTSKSNPCVKFTSLVVLIHPWISGLNVAVTVTSLSNYKLRQYCAILQHCDILYVTL